MTPVMVVVEPASIVEIRLKLIVLEMVPLDPYNVPPFKVISSARVLRTSNTPPLTCTPPALVPRALLVFVLKVPAVTVVKPVQLEVLLPSVKVPVPVLVIAPVWPLALFQLPELVVQVLPSATLNVFVPLKVTSPVQVWLCNSSTVAPCKIKSNCCC